MIVLKGSYGRKTRKIPMNLFFLELIIVLLFLSISGAIILKMFASANVINERGSLTERSVMNVQSVSEIYSVKGDLKEAVDMLFGSGRYTVDNSGGDNKTEVYTVVLDAEMFPIIMDDIRERYGMVRIDFTERQIPGMCGVYHELDSKVTLLADGGKEVYYQTCGVYVPASAEASVPATGSRAEMVKEG